MKINKICLIVCIFLITKSICGQEYQKISILPRMSDNLISIQGKKVGINEKRAYEIFDAVKNICNHNPKLKKITDFVSQNIRTKKIILTTVTDKTTPLTMASTAFDSCLVRAVTRAMEARRIGCINGATSIAPITVAGLSMISPKVAMIIARVAKV